MTQALKSKLAAVTIPGVSFVMVPSGQDGAFTATPPTFAQADVCTLAAVNGQPGVLCILLTIFHSDVVAPEVTSAKTVTATDASHTGSLTISPDGFNNIFIFEAKQATKGTGDLPPGTTIATTLEQGQIGLHMAGTNDGPFWTANWTIDGDMLASISNGALALNLTNVVSHVSVSVDWWMWLASVVVFNAPAAGVLAWLQSQIASGAGSTLQSSVATLTKDVDQASTSISGIPVTFDKAEVQPQGLILAGMAQAPPLFGTVVQGMVTQSNEAPINGATVTINPDGQPQGWFAQTTTGPDGRYKFDTFPLDVFANNPPGPGPFPITAAQSDFITSTGDTVTIKWGQIITQDFVLAPVLDVTIEGHVLANGGPVNGATVTVAYGEAPDLLLPGPPPTNTQPDGSYSIQMKPGQFTFGYTVSVTAPGFDPQVRPVGPIANGGTVQEDFTLVAPHPFTVMGQVTGDGPDSTTVPVADAKISVFPKTQPSPPLATYQGQTLSDGSYSIGPVNPGTYTGDYIVLVQATHFEPQKQDVVQPIGPSVEVDIELSAVPLKTPKPGGTPVGGIKPGTMG
jgi:hypothetical protein